MSFLFTSKPDKKSDQAEPVPLVNDDEIEDQMEEINKEDLNTSSEDDASDADKEICEISKSPCKEESCEEDYMSFSVDNEKENFVISINGRPYYYTEDEKAATKVMWGLTRTLVTNLNKDLCYNMRITPHGEQRLDICACYKFFVISYENLVHTITYRRARLAIPIKGE